VTAFGKPLIPTFAFIDPYGYKGLSLGLVNAVIKDWACECLFFFNCNRINPGINNRMVRCHMEALFEVNRLARLRVAIKGCSPAERELLVMAALAEALKDHARCEGKESSSFVEEVPSFEYNPRPGLFLDERSMRALAKDVANDLAGQMMTVGEVFERHSPDKLYVLRNYKDAAVGGTGAGDRQSRPR
jgi:hypothetical protein